MLGIINETPFAADAGLVFDRFGANIAAVALKATFILPESQEPVQIAGEQAPVLHAEQYFDTPENSGIRYPADIVPEKKNTDIVVNGCVHSPDKRPVTRLKASVRAGGCYKQIEAVGDRIWKKRRLFIGFKITRPRLFVKMPITCARLYGGSGQTKKGETEVFSPNPHGTGFIARKKSVHKTPLPNFEDPGQRIKSWKIRPAPATFGCANASADHRIKFAGTYDEKWEKTHCPLYPEDLDPRFFNTAQPGLVADGFLRGGEPVRLENLSESGSIAFRLPVYKIGFLFNLAQERIYRQADLYTVVIEPEEKRFYMVWGCAVDAGNQPAKLHGVKARHEQTTD
ncbi:MAG: DUF2169 domain-containing protein [Desulfobacterales bacterium]